MALNTRAFGYSEIWYQSWVGAKFDKKAPLGTYKASATVTLKNGESQSDNFEDTYFRHQRNQYAIQLVEEFKDIETADIELTVLIYQRLLLGLKTPLNLK